MHPIIFTITAPNSGNGMLKHIETRNGTPQQSQTEEGYQDMRSPLLTQTLPRITAPLSDRVRKNQKRVELKARHTNHLDVACDVHDSVQGGSRVSCPKLYACIAGELAKNISMQMCGVRSRRHES